MRTKTVVVGFSRSKRKFPIFGWGIQLWESAYWSIKLRKLMWVDQSHCFLLFDTTRVFSNWTVYHAAKGMLHYLAFPTFKKENKAVKLFKFEIEEKLYWKIRDDYHTRLGENTL